MVFFVQESAHCLRNLKKDATEYTYNGHVSFVPYLMSL
jgi:hypothetical protein